MKKYIVYTNYIWLIAKFSTAEKADKEFRGAQNGSSLKNAPCERLGWLLLCQAGLELSPRLSQGPLAEASSPEGAPVAGSLQAGCSLGWVSLICWGHTWLLSGRAGGPIVAELITGQKGAPVPHRGQSLVPFFQEAARDYYQEGRIEAHSTNGKPGSRLDLVQLKPGRGRRLSSAPRTLARGA